MLSSAKAGTAAPIEELKAFLRIEDAGEDALLAGLMRAATEAVEAWLGWRLIAREISERGCVKDGSMRLGATPVQSVSSVALVGHEGIEEIMPAGQWMLDVSRFGAATLSFTGVGEGAKVVARYLAGLADEWNGLPEPVRLGVLRAAAHFHTHRDGTDDVGLPPAVARLVSPWRVKRLR